MSYKVVETSIVTDEEIEKVLNHWAGQGYFFSSIHFVTTESSRRPAMAFILFTRDEACALEPAVESRGRR